MSEAPASAVRLGRRRAALASAEPMAMAPVEWKGLGLWLPIRRR